MKGELSPIILASSSIYRQQQLTSLGIKFTAQNPDIDETADTIEPPEQLAQRLAVAKAVKIKAKNQTACVIGSDQVCAFNGRVFGKPGSENKAREQLLTFSGSCIKFFTALCVIDQQGQQLIFTDITQVKFRSLSVEEIDRYIELEKPMDCAGSFKVESLGLSLFESVESTDPSALMGLPLIKLCEFLRLCGYKIP